ncbi:nucleoside-diphosphate kinase [Candidatus Bathyarchaeota archaeon]|nr:nucleoside-diphosphate kinase [Candidatus Bathyarchaeota archaeon]
MNLIERTLVLLKPETVLRGLVGEIISRIEKRGLSITSFKIVSVTRRQAEELYIMHRGKPFYESLIEHITSGPVVAMVVEGLDAIRTMRRMIGATNPCEADPGTIRGDYGLTITKNVIHAADSFENAEREIKIFFKPEEIISIQRHG